MDLTRRAFTPEYKEQSVTFVVDGGRPVAEVARNIGVHEITLGKWVKVARDAAESGKNPDAPLGESERTELARLRLSPEMTNPRSPSCGCRWSWQKSSDLVRERQSVRFAAVAGWAYSDAYPVSFMCAWLGVSRSGYYAWRGAEPSKRSGDDSVLIAIMKKVYKEARGNAGVRRMRAGLAALGHLASHKRVHRLMQAAGLRGRRPKAWKRTTIGGDQPVPAPASVFHRD